MAILVCVRVETRERERESRGKKVWREMEGKKAEVDEMAMRSRGASSSVLLLLPVPPQSLA